MRQNVYENLSPAQVEAHFDVRSWRAYSVSLPTDWQRNVQSSLAEAPRGRKPI
jgi:hypothetical protein